MGDQPSANACALLGLLSIRSWSTYELAKQIERSLGWFWPRAERKIYDEAKRLVTMGLAEATEELVGKRRRTVYSITPAGRAALAAWLKEASAPPKLEAEAMVRVFFADAGTLDDLRATLRGCLDDAEARFASLRDMIRSASEDDYEFAGRMHVNTLALRFQLAHYRALADSAKWALGQIDEWNSTSDPADWDWRTVVAEPLGSTQVPS